MRKLNFLLKTALILTGIVAFTSCNSKYEEKFSFLGFDTYIVKDDYSYTPYFYFVVGYGELSKGEVTTSEGLPLHGRSFFENVYETYLSSTNSDSSLEDVLGGYKFSATSTEGEFIKGDVPYPDYPENAYLGDMSVSNFTFSNVGRFSATFEAVEGATQYGFFILPNIEGKEESRANGWAAGIVNTSSGNQTVTYSLSAQDHTYLENFDRITVYPFSMLSPFGDEYNSTYGISYGLVQFGDGKVLVKSAGGSFVEE